MASYITVGFVFNGADEQKIISKLQILITDIMQKDSYYKSAKVCKDQDGNNWIELDADHLTDINKYTPILAKGYFGQVDFVTKFFTCEKIPISVRVEKALDYFGILIDIEEKDLLKSNVQSILSKVDDHLIEFILNLYNLIEYDYAFADNEAELQYSPNEIQLLNINTYSIFAKKSISDCKSDISVYKSEWYLDGLTTRL